MLMLIYSGDNMIKKNVTETGYIQLSEENIKDIRDMLEISSDVSLPQIRLVRTEGGNYLEYEEYPNKFETISNVKLIHYLYENFNLD